MYSFSFFRELLELSEALQRDLVQSRTETLHYKQQIENRQYLQEHNEKNLQLLHKVKHSQSDLYNNQVPILAQNASIGSVPSNVIPSNIINNDIRYSFQPISICQIFLAIFLITEFLSSLKLHIVFSLLVNNRCS